MTMNPQVEVEGVVEQNPRIALVVEGEGLQREEVGQDHPSYQEEVAEMLQVAFVAKELLLQGVELVAMELRVVEHLWEGLNWY